MEEKKCIFCELNPVKEGEEICSSCLLEMEKKISQNKNKGQEKVVDLSKRKAILGALGQSKISQNDTDFQYDK